MFRHEILINFNNFNEQSGIKSNWFCGSKWSNPDWNPGPENKKRDKNGWEEEGGRGIENLNIQDTPSSSKWNSFYAECQFEKYKNRLGF